MEKQCVICGQSFTPRSGRSRPQISCSPECAQKRKNQKSLAAYHRHHPNPRPPGRPPQIHPCIICGAPVPPPNGRKRRLVCDADHGQRQAVVELPPIPPEPQLPQDPTDDDYWTALEALLTWTTPEIDKARRKARVLDEAADRQPSEAPDSGEWRHCSRCGSQFYACHYGGRLQRALCEECHGQHLATLARRLDKARAKLDHLTGPWQVAVDSLLARWRLATGDA